MTPSSFPYAVGVDYGMHHHDDQLQQEWNKLRKAQQKLALQEERLRLDQQMLKAEKRNAKRHNKIAKSMAIPATVEENSSVGSTSSHRALNNENTDMSDMPELIRTLREQLAEAQLKIEEREKREAEIAETTNAMEAQLAATQRSLATISIEKDTIRQERDTLQQQQQVICKPSRQLSIDRCQKCADHQIELQKLQDKLEETRLNYSQAIEKMEQQNLEWQLQQQSFEEKSHSSKAEWQELVDELRNEREALESEMQELREVNSSQLQQLNTQIPLLKELNAEKLRNAHLLEEAHVEISKLQARCEEMEETTTTQNSKVEVLQSEKESLQKKCDALDQEVKSLLGQQKDLAAKVFERNEDGRSKIIIPLDDTVERSNLVKMGMKHVVEHEWTNFEGLMGLYTGWLDLSGNPHGHGTWRTEDGSIYDGEWKRGVRDGHGVYSSGDGDLYQGTWQNDEQHGRGVYVWKDGQLFTGDYIVGMRDGKGIESWPSDGRPPGARFEGEYHDDKRNGPGKYWYPDGRCYQGVWRDDRAIGEGMPKDGNGSILTRDEWNSGNSNKRR